MKLRFTIASSVAVLVVFSSAMADQLPGRADAGDKLIPARQGPTGDTPTGDAIVQIAAVTQEIAHFASTAEIVTPPTTTEIATPPIVGGAAPPTVPAAHKGAAAKHAAKGKLAERQQLASADPKPELVRAIGRSETGSAAWYGGRYVGRRTSSGERLDSIHPTAAHRTLPLNSLARVTNLKNGRSVIVRVTDRGPVSESLLIDMSPRAADQLAMRDDGIVPVRVEQVVAVPPDAK